MKLTFDTPPVFKPDDVRDFYIRFTSPRNHCFPIFSWAIKILDWWFDASHVQIMWYNQHHKEWMIYEASGTTVHFVGRFKQEEIPWNIAHSFKITVSGLAAWKTVKWCIAHAGLKYDIKGVIGFLPVKFMSLFGKKIKNPWGKGEAEQFCSEMVGFIMRDVWGFKINEDLNVAGPKVIFKYLLDASKTFDTVVKEL